jgi:hypothetical protein
MPATGVDQLVQHRLQITAGVDLTRHIAQRQYLHFSIQGAHLNMEVTAAKLPARPAGYLRRFRAMSN